MAAGSGAALDNIPTLWLAAIDLTPWLIHKLAIGSRQLLPANSANTYEPGNKFKPGRLLDANTFEGFRGRRIPFGKQSQWLATLALNNIALLNCLVNFL